MGRRRVLQTSALALAGGATLAGAGPAAAQSGTDLSDWFSNVSNADGVTDETGESAVTITVGAQGNGGGFAFDPAAVRVDPGTTVTWEWTGKGGQHNVVAEDGSFESELNGNEGATFEHAFESEGIYKYVCVPHEAMGMKAAVIVGDAEVTVSGGGAGSGGGGADAAAEREYLPEEPDYGGWFANTDNYEGTVDMRGRDEVRVTVGAEGNGGGFAFDPPAIAVDPGTDVIFEWVGDDGPHQVAAESGDYESPSQEGGEWGLTVDGTGITKFACVHHGDAGMRGAVVVGDPYATVYDVGTTELAIGGGIGAALLSPLAFGAALWAHDKLTGDDGEPERSVPGQGGHRPGHGAD